jgi:hypothetical protein
VPPTPAPTTQASTLSATEILLQQLLTQQLQAPKPDDVADKFLGMCESEYNRLLVYAHIQDGDANKLPSFWRTIAEKNKSKEGKRSDVRAALRDTKVTYRDAKIKITPALLTMIVNRAFEGEVTSSKYEAVKGLSPFALPPISNTQLDEINALDNEIEAATSVSTSDIKKNQTHFGRSR